MARVNQWKGVRPESFGVFAAAAACLALGACAQVSKPSIPQAVASNDAAATETTDNRSDLEKATEYWGKAYANNPRALEPALNYAKNLKALGEKKRALAVLQQASNFHGNSRELASEYGRLALEFDQISLATRLLAAADDPGRPDWRVLSARGTVLAKQGKYKDAIPYYERALTHAHDHPSVLSNLALAHAMSGDPQRAESMLRKAAAADRGSHKIRQNLALVLGLQGKYDEGKLLASNDMSADSAAENANTLRRIVKLEPEMPATPRALPASEPEKNMIAAAGSKSWSNVTTGAISEEPDVPLPERKTYPEMGDGRAPFTVAQWLSDDDEAPKTVAMRPTQQ
jgi:Flp pilus assembly protein TadD